MRSSVVGIALAFVIFNSKFSGAGSIGWRRIHRRSSARYRHRSSSPPLLSPHRSRSSRLGYSPSLESEPGHRAAES